MTAILLFIIPFLGFSQVENILPPIKKTIVIKCELYDSTGNIKNLVEEGVKISELRNIRLKCDKLDDKRKYRMTITSFEGKTELTKKTSFSSLLEFNLDNINTNVANRLLIEIDIKDNFQEFILPLMRD